MKSLVLAEKPSVGKELGRVLGCTSRGGYLESDTHIVTWALGHLVTLCPPDTYSDQYRHWSMRNLPMLPQTLRTMVIENTKDQFELVRSLLEREDVCQIIIATDAGREGELVARWILRQCNCTKKAKRLWISSQTDMAIREGFANLRDASDYDNLFEAAQSRSFADWYIGYNVSRALTCHFDTRLSAGRVQTPTLSLICDREDEIESFTGRFYWTLKADFSTFKASWYSDEGTVRIESEKKAQDLREKLISKTGTVKAVTNVEKSEKPPLAYDLTELQRDANTLLGFSAKQTLDTLQRLYEVHKIVTYPRTDSRYITEDIVPTLTDRILALTSTELLPKCADLLKKGIRKDLSGLVDNSQVSDHHALLPTEQKVDVSKLSEDEHSLWLLVVTRFLETLSSDYVYNTTTVRCEVEGEQFNARLTVPSSLGYREIKQGIMRTRTGLLDLDNECEVGLISLKEGQSITVRDIELRKNATPSPTRYTEADLLYAMEHAGRFVEDKDLKSHLGNGLGTPATRADIIEKLIGSSCIERKGVYLYPTAKGRELVRLVPKQLKSPVLTGQWEKRLSDISMGLDNSEDFINDIKKNAADLVSQVASNYDSFDPARMGDSKRLCPACQWPMVKVLDEFERTHYLCQRFSCGYEELHKRLVVKDKVLIAKQVVKESRYNRARQKAPASVPRQYTDHSEGSTFADFLKASQERKKRDEEKRNKR